MSPYTESRWSRRRFLIWQFVILLLVLGAFITGGKALLDVKSTQHDTKDIALQARDLAVSNAATAKIAKDTADALAVKVAADKAKTDIEIKKSLALCKRALLFAPPIGKDMLSRGVFDQAQYRAYIDTLPGKC